jgi:uncharacterized protein YecE (DUF72 family)
VGTSGYSYAEWVGGGFYPSGTRSADMLAVYARSFPITELNYTWYQMPRAEMIERLLQRAPTAFRFTAKLNRSLTHEIDPDLWRGCAAQYRDGIAPLHQSGQLMAILVQLPPGFVYVPPNRRYLAALLDELEGLPLAVEFRHRSWAREQVFAELRRRRVALVAVDTPELPGLFPPLAAVTNPALFYVRFHGRNSRGWRSGDMQKQFDYDYSDEDLQQWCDKQVVDLLTGARDGVLFFNNHVRAQAPANARRLMALLRARGLPVQEGHVDG